MVPAQPPFPTAWNLRFQAEAGSQISTLISESGVGVRVAATRQNSGSDSYGFAAPAPRRAPGGAKEPAATSCASVIFAAGRERDARLSQESARAAEIVAARTAS